MSYKNNRSVCSRRKKVGIFSFDFCFCQKSFAKFLLCVFYVFQFRTSWRFLVLWCVTAKFQVGRLGECLWEQIPTRCKYFLKTEFIWTSDKSEWFIFFVENHIGCFTPKNPSRFVFAFCENKASFGLAKNFLSPPSAFVVVSISSGQSVFGTEVV